MKILLVIFMVAALLVSATPAFAKQGPGDGGFFTKFFNGLLKDSWETKTTDKTVGQQADKNFDTVQKQDK